MESSGIEKKIIGQDRITIVGFGDSLTQGWMARKGYLDFLYEMLSAKYPEKSFDIMNRGVPGDTAESGLWRISRDVIDCDPDIVLVQFALNDAFMGVPVDVFREQVSEIVSSIKNDTTADAALLTSVYISEPMEYRMAMNFYNALGNISVREKIPIVRVHEYWEEAVRAGADQGRLVQDDGVHPTVEGYRLMAEAVFRLF